jgi:phage regulator Rha-like protein
MTKLTATVPAERIVSKILLVRGRKVMIDTDLAELYDVPTKALNQQVRRNLDRFPDDFMYQLNADEMASLNRSQIVTGSQKHRDPKSRPYVFTEHGVAMLSSVLKSKRAVQVNIQIIRTFIKLKEMLATNKELRDKIETLEHKYDGQFSRVFDALARLLIQETQPKTKIGFDTSRQ